MKRLFDLSLCIPLLIILALPMGIVSLIIKFTSKGPILHWSKRSGKDGLIFEMPKFRSMLENTPVLATHLISNPDEYLFPFGSFLRRFSIDEFPQLLSILLGQMSFVGPRPALFNQTDLIELRKKNGIQSLVPGLTGWAQVNGRDNLTIKQKVELEVEYLNSKSFWLDFKILWLTFIKVTRGEGVSH
jgi:O-antigen biosynthesis protein WbqP